MSYRVSSSHEGTDLDASTSAFCAARTWLASIYHVVMRVALKLAICSSHSVQDETADGKTCSMVDGVRTSQTGERRHGTRAEPHTTEFSTHKGINAFANENASTGEKI